MRAEMWLVEATEGLRSPGLSLGTTTADLAPSPALQEGGPGSLSFRL